MSAPGASWSSSVGRLPVSRPGPRSAISQRAMAEALVRANVHIGEAYAQPDTRVICAAAEAFFGQGVLF